MGKELSNRDYEFDVELEDHEVVNTHAYRLHFLNYHRIGEDRGMGPHNTGVIDYPFKPFALPKGMTMEDAYKVLSYLTDYIEKNPEYPIASLKSVSALDKVLDLERLGFSRTDVENPVDLFTVTGRLLLFKESPYYPKYFEWYYEGITKDEVIKIYKSCGIEFRDLERVKLEMKNGK